VNTTSVGMHAEGDPAPWLQLNETQLVYDIVYTPPETPLIKRAAESGCRLITGDMMFAAQAAAQYELYKTLATDAV
jgi:3-dehydroquinate dehydratase/shikimate dehydrogenase